MERNGFSGTTPQDHEHHHEVVPNMAGNEKVSPYVFSASLPHLLSQFRVAEKIAQAKGSPLHRMNHKPRNPMNDLGGDSTCRSPNNRLPFPHPFRNGKAKPFPGGFL